MKKDIEEHGHTPGCKGCEKLQRGPGVAWQHFAGHSEECRQRIMERLKDSPEGRARLEREAKRMSEALFRISEAEARKIDQRVAAEVRPRRDEGGSASQGEDPGQSTEEEEPPAKKSRRSPPSGNQDFPSSPARTDAGDRSPRGASSQPGTPLSSPGTPGEGELRGPGGKPLSERARARTEEIARSSGLWHHRGAKRKSEE